MGLWSRVRLPRKSRGSWWRMAAWRRWVVAVGEWWSLTGDISRWVVAGWSGGRLVRRSDGLNGGDAIGMAVKWQVAPELAMMRTDDPPSRIRWLDPAPIVVAVVAAVVMCGSRFLVDGERVTLVAAAVPALVFAVLCYLIGVLLCSWFDAASGGRAVASWLRSRPRSSLRDAVRGRFVVYWLVLLVCWTPWFAFCWPGVMRDDTIVQFMQSSGYHRYFTQHPLFDTLVFGVFWRIGGAMGNQVWGMAVYTVVQALLMAANLALVLCYLRSRGVPRLALAFGLAYCAGFYALVQSVPTMSKDSLTTLFVVPLALIATEVCLSRGAVLRRWPVCVALVALVVLTMVSKRTMLPVLVCFAVPLVLAASKARVRTVCCLLVAVILAEGVWTPAVNHVTRANHSIDRDVFGLIMLPVARIESQDPGGITAQERDELGPVMDLDLAGDDYNPTRSDETSWTMNIHATASQKLTALGAWARIGSRHPQTFIEAYVTLTQDWYYPSHGIGFPSSSAYVFSDRYMRQWDTFVIPPVTARFVLKDFLDTLGPERPEVAWRERVNHAVKRSVENPASSYAVYLTYLPLLIAAYFISRRRWRNLAAWSLFGLTALSLYASPIVLCWFATPAFHMLPGMVGLGFIRRDGPYLLGSRRR